MILSIISSVVLAGSACNDGTYSDSEGRGTCSHHGGVIGNDHYIPSYSYDPSYVSSYGLSQELKKKAEYKSTFIKYESPTLIVGYSDKFNYERPRFVSGYSDNFKVSKYGVIKYSLDDESQAGDSMFEYTCYSSDAKIGIHISLVFSLDDDEVFTKVENHLVSKSEADKVKIYLIHGSSKILTFNWESRTLSNGSLLVEKTTSNVKKEKELQGVGYLSSSEIINILSADYLIAEVNTKRGTREEYKIKMSGVGSFAEKAIELCLK